MSTAETLSSFSYRPSDCIEYARDEARALKASYKRLPCPLIAHKSWAHLKVDESFRKRTRCDFLPENTGWQATVLPVSERVAGGHCLILLICTRPTNLCSQQRELEQQAAQQYRLYRSCKGKAVFSSAVLGRGGPEHQTWHMMPRPPELSPAAHPPDVSTPL